MVTSEHVHVYLLHLAASHMHKSLHKWWLDYTACYLMWKHPMSSWYFQYRQCGYCILLLFNPYSPKRYLLIGS